MADEIESRSRSKGRPPPYIESYLTAKNQCVPLKIKPRKYYCVLYGNLIQCFNTKKSYTEKRENVKAQVDLDLVCSISETVIPRRKKPNFCFKLVLQNNVEVDFEAQSKQEMKNWVDSLIETKEFWEHSKWKEEQNNESFVRSNSSEHTIKQTNEESLEDDISEEIDSSLVKVSIIMSHGPPYMADVPPDGDIDDLWIAALKRLPGHFCSKCDTCQLRRSAMELWSVTKDGVAYKIEKYFNTAEHSTAANPIYLLEHNFKLLIVYFEDSTFLVSPADISTKAREIPNIDLFSRKLSEIECNDVQLYLQTACGTVTPFSLEDAPLQTLWEQHGNHWARKAHEGEKFLLKSKAILKNNTENIVKKVQQGKLKSKLEERKQKEALKKIEINGCKTKKTIVLPSLPSFRPSKALPIDLRLTSSIDENHFSYEPVKPKHTVEHWTFLPSPEKTTTSGQLTAPFCPPDDSFSGKRNRSKTDVGKHNETGRHSIEGRSRSESSTIRRKGALKRRKSDESFQKSLTNLEKNIKKDEQKPEKELSKQNLNQLDDRLSCDSNQENDCTAVVDLQEAQDTLQVKSSTAASKEGSNVCNKDEINDKFSSDNFNSTEKIVSKSEPKVCETFFNQQSGEETFISCDNERVNGEILESELGKENGIEKCIDQTSLDCTRRDSSEMDSVESSVERESLCLSESNTSSTDNSVEEQQHCCDFKVIESPFTLKSILQQYSRLSVDEEEVGVALPPKVICLSSCHLENIDGYWVTQDDIDLDDDQECRSENRNVFKLSGNIKVVFDRRKRNWDVKRIKNVKTDDKHVITETKSDSIGPLVPSVIDSANEDASSIDERQEDDRSEDNFPPLTITNCGQSFQPIDDDYELDDQPITPQEFTEIRVLEDAIQKLFYHIEKTQVLPVECLDDVKYPDVRRLVCCDLCSALSGILNNGLKKRWNIIGATRYTVWDVIKGVCSTDITSGIVKKINSLGSLDDKIRFDLFVCECMNDGAGALASWLECLQSERKRLSMFYDSEALVMKLPKDKLERLLSRLTFLPFSITLLSHVQRKIKESGLTTFGFE